MLDAIYYCCMSFLVILFTMVPVALLIHILTKLVIYMYCIISCQIDRRRNKHAGVMSVHKKSKNPLKPIDN